MSCPSRCCAIWTLLSRPLMGASWMAWRTVFLFSGACHSAAMPHLCRHSMPVASASMAPTAKTVQPCMQHAGEKHAVTQSSTKAVEAVSFVWAARWAGDGRTRPGSCCSTSQLQSAGLPQGLCSAQPALPGIGDGPAWWLWQHRLPWQPAWQSLQASRPLASMASCRLSTRCSARHDSLLASAGSPGGAADRWDIQVADRKQVAWFRSPKEGIRPLRAF